MTERHEICPEHARLEARDEALAKVIDRFEAELARLRKTLWVLAMATAAMAATQGVDVLKIVAGAGP